MAMLIIIPVTLLFLFSILAIIFCCFRKAQGRPRNIGTVTTTTTYSTPRDATGNEYQAPPLPFYNPRPHPYQQNFSQHRTLGNGGPAGGCPIPHFGSQQYFCGSKESGSPVKAAIHQPHLQYHSSPAPAYASVPICDLPSTGSTSTSGLSRGPPLPCRSFPNQSLRGGDRNSYNTQGQARILNQQVITTWAADLTWVLMLPKYFVSRTLDATAFDTDGLLIGFQGFSTQRRRRRRGWSTERSWICFHSAKQSTTNLGSLVHELRGEWGILGSKEFPNPSTNPSLKKAESSTSGLQFLRIFVSIRVYGCYVIWVSSFPACSPLCGAMENLSI